MIYIEYDDLTIISLKEKKDFLTFEELGRVLQEHPANILYCEFDGLLYGIVSMGDIDRADENHRETVIIHMGRPSLFGTN